MRRKILRLEERILLDAAAGAVIAHEVANQADSASQDGSNNDQNQQTTDSSQNSENENSTTDNENNTNEENSASDNGDESAVVTAIDANPEDAPARILVISSQIHDSQLL